MKIARIIRKNFKLSLILALLAAGILLPWHFDVFGSNQASIRQLSGNQRDQGELLAKGSVTVPNQEKKLDFPPSVSQGNTVLSVSRPPESQPEVETMKVLITGYSSTPSQTNGDPFTTAAGTRVRDGIVANNHLPFGTKIRIPELYGDKTFKVEDRLHWSKRYNHVDIWFSSKQQALNFGVRKTFIEILED